MRLLTIAGSDSGGGAGIQADLKTFAAFGAHGSSVLTCVTAQNTREVRAVHRLPPDVVVAQLDAVLDDIGADAVKTGLLPSPEIVEVVGARCAGLEVPLVVDPVLVSSSGTPLCAAGTADALLAELLPHATVVTPNLDELAVLSGHTDRSEQGRIAGARVLLSLGCPWVVVTGGHLEDRPVDLVAGVDGTIEFLDGPRVDVGAAHGTGCTFSSALATCLAEGDALLEAARRAKEFVRGALERAVRVGDGAVVLGHIVG